eukprot:2468679-Alexandrium_andersonii.AAC.1
MPTPVLHIELCALGNAREAAARAPAASPRSAPAAAAELAEPEEAADDIDGEELDESQTEAAIGRGTVYNNTCTKPLQAVCSGVQ